MVEAVDDEGGCPSCGVVSALVKDRPVSGGEGLAARVGAVALVGA